MSTAESKASGATSSGHGKQIFRNTISAWGYKILKAVLTFFLNPLLILEFGKEGYGLIVLFSTLIAFSDLADLGIRPALGRQLSEAASRKEYGIFNGLVNSALAVYATLWVLLSGILVLGTGWLVSIFTDDGKLAADAESLFRYYGVFTLAVAFSRPAFSAVVAGMNRFDMRNYVEMIYTIISQVGVLAVLWLTDAGLWGWVLVNGVAQLVNVTMLARSANKVAPWLEISFKHTSMQVVKGLYGFGSMLFLQQWARRIKYDADPFVISYYLNPGALATYKPANSLMANIRPLLTSFAGQLYPVATGMHAKGEKAGMQRLFLSSTRYTLLLSIPMLVFFTVFGHEVMAAWLGRVLSPEDVETAGWVLIGWAVIEFAVSLEGASWSILFGMKKIRFPVFADLVVATLSVTCGILIVTQTDLGVKGLVLAPACLELVVRPMYQFYAARNLSLPMGQVLRESWLRPFGLLAILGGFTFGLEKLLPATDVWLLLVDLALVGTVFLILLWSIGLSGEERGMIRNKVLRGKTPPAPVVPEPFIEPEEQEGAGITP